MIAYLSPAKNIRTASAPLPLTKPRLEEQTAMLLQSLKAYAPWQLESLLQTNPKIALRAFEAFQQYSPSAPGWPAAAAFDGIAYRHLHAGDFTKGDWLFAQEHLRIASAFYGLLRPLDGIQPHRLEMALPFRIQNKTLYDFWGDTLCRSLFEKEDTVVNLASLEYAKAVRRWLKPGQRFLTCTFVLLRRGKWITLPTEAKALRGEMARFLIKNRLQSPEQLQSFTYDGYAYCPASSAGNLWVFAKTP